MAGERCLSRPLPEDGMIVWVDSLGNRQGYLSLYTRSAHVTAQGSVAEITEALEGLLAEIRQPTQPGPYSE